MVESSFTNYVVVVSSHVAVTKTPDFRPAFNKDFLEIEKDRECGFTLKCVRDMIRICSQKHGIDKCSQHSQIIWPFELNG